VKHETRRIHPRVLVFVGLSCIFCSFALLFCVSLLVCCMKAV